MKKSVNKKQQFWCFLLAVCFLLPAVIHAQTLNGSFPAESLEERITRIVKSTGQNIAYDKNKVRAIRVTALNVDGKNVEQALTGSLSSTDFAYRKKTDNTFAIYEKKAEDTEQAKEKGTGSLSGTVLDEKQEPVIGATVVIVGTTTGTATDANGSYKLPMVNAGTLSVRFSFISYETLEVNEVKINPGKATRLDVVMKESSEELNEVVVTASYKQASSEGLYAKQKAMVAMADGISADQIKKTSDNNVAQVLGRVSGITVDDGKYAVIRGLSERYNNMELNGSSLPSTEPNRRNFSFDVIPSALVDNILVSKTFTPDMQGEFVGGVVQVNTLAVPDEKFFTLTVGSGFNTNSTGKDFWSNKRYKSDYFFGNKRDWYGKDWKLEEYNQYIYATSVNDWDAVNAMNAKIPNRWGLEKYTGAPTQNYSVTVGLPFNLGGGNRLGVVAALTYRHEENTEDLEEANYRIPGEYMIPGEGGRYKFVTATGAVANIGWKRPGHAVTWRNLFNNRFTHTNLQRANYSDESGVYLLEQFSAPLINRLWQTQLDGEHKLFGDRLTVSWTADYNKLNRDQPEDRLAMGSIQNTVVEGVPQTDENGQYMVEWSFGLNGETGNFNRGHINISELEETKKNIGANLEYAFTVAGNRQKLKAGYRGSFRESEYEQQFLRPQGNGALNYSQKLSGLAIHDYYVTENFAGGLLYYIPFGLQGSRKDAYEGDQDLHAGYLMAELNFLKKLNLTAGVRVEDCNMQVRTVYWDNNLGTTDTLMVTQNTDWLPAVTAIYNITGNLSFRAAYSKTLARPDFRELTHQTKYYNVDDRVTYYGAGELKQPSTNNIDLRLEWYPQAGEVVSLSAFYKKFKDPIEMIGRVSQDGKHYDMLYANLEESTAKGLEFNLRKSFGFMAPHTFLHDLYLTANAMIMEADVQYNYAFLTSFGEQSGDNDGEVEPDRDRPLQGLSPYSVNAGLAYEGKRLGAAVNYGRAGRKLVVGGKEEKWDEYENARDVLELQLSARLLKGRMEIKANAGDLLGQAVIIYRNMQYVVESGSSGYTEEDRTDDMNYNSGDYILSKYKKGTTFSLSVSYKF